MPSFKLPMMELEVSGPERTFSPSSASWTVPMRCAGVQTTKQLALRPCQLAVMVMTCSEEPAYTLVTTPEEETTAAEGSLLVQVMAAFS